MITDGSVGPAGAIGRIGNDFAIPHTLGTKVGGNLFHSFSEFNLLSGESATFSGPNDVTNILARVTGGSASAIDGTIRSTIPGANLFLMNPRGFVFGPNAKLDVDGSFAVTTADYLKLSDGGRFDAMTSANDSLTAAPVSAFGFLSASPASVSFNGSQITARPGTGLSIVAGDLVLDGSTLAAPSGRLSLVSVATAGEVTSSSNMLATLPASVVPAMGSIALKNHSSANIDGDGGGHLVIRGGRLQLTGAAIVGSRNIGAVRGGDVDVRATTELSIHDGQIRTNAAGVGDGGNVSIEAASITIDGQGVILSPGSESFNGIVAVVGETGTGHGGNVAVRGTDLALSVRSEIATSTFGHGDAGNINVTASKLAIDGKGLGFTNGIFAGVYSNAVGDGGNVTVQSDDLNIIGGSEISSNILGHGDGGKVSVSAATLTIDRNGAPNSNGIFATVSSAAVGHGGDIVVDSNELTLRGGGKISATTYGLGNAGGVIVNARDIIISGAAPGNTSYSAISANSISQAQGGDAGSVSVTATGKLDIEAGAQITSTTLGLGNAGKVTVNAKDITISGATSDNSSVSVIFADSNSPTQGGNAGSVSVTATGKLDIEAGGQISSTTLGLGNAGKVTVSARDITISGAVPDNAGFPSSISANSQSSAQGGDAGSVTVTATGKLDIEAGGQISSTTSGLGKAGNVTVSTKDTTISGATSDNSSVSAIFADSNSATKGGDAGDVTVTATGKLEIEAGGQISSLTSGLGNAGNVTVSAGNITIAGVARDDTSTSSISADSASSAEGGNAGDVTVSATSQLLITGGGEISSQTLGLGKAGNVTVHAQNITLSGISPQDDVSAIFADSASSTKGGDAGTVSVSASGNLVLVGGGQISSATFGLGKAGNVTVRAGNMTIAGTSPQDDVSAIYADSNPDMLGDPSGAAGNVTVIAAGKLVIAGGGQISSETFGLGNAGSVSVKAGTATISGGTSQIVSDSQPDAEGGAAGNVLVNIAGQLNLLGGAQISASTLGLGAGGKIAISAEDINISGIGPGFVSGILAGSYSSALGGNAGDVLVAATGRISLSGAGEISSSTFGSGKAGDLAIHAGSMDIDGSALPGSFTGVVVQAHAGSTGDAGNLELVVAHDLSIRGSGEIQADTFGRGHGGDLTIHSGELTIDGSATPTRGTGIFAGADKGSTGDAGNLAVVVDHLLTITGSGAISAGTSARGDGGNLTVRSNDLTIDGSAPPTIVTAIRATARSGSTGNAGDILVTVDHLLSIATSGEISAGTSSTGKGGGVTVHAGSLIIDGAATPTTLTGISGDANTGSKGNAGDVRVDVDSTVHLNGGTIASSSAGKGNAGSVVVAAGASAFLTGGSVISVAAPNANAGSVTVSTHGGIELHDGSTISASAGRSGGDIFISARDLFFLDHSSVVATAGTSFLTGARGGAAGAGGNISIDPTFIILDHGTISANAALGAGGNILLQAQNFLASESPITATGSERCIGCARRAACGHLEPTAGALHDAARRWRE